MVRYRFEPLAFYQLLDLCQRVGAYDSETLFYLYTIVATYFGAAKDDLDTERAYFNQSHPNAIPVREYHEWKFGIYLAKLQYVVMNPLLLLSTLDWEIPNYKDPIETWLPSLFGREVVFSLLR
jgi:hypothetical protein